MQGDISTLFGVMAVSGGATSLYNTLISNKCTNKTCSKCLVDVGFMICGSVLLYKTLGTHNTSSLIYLAGLGAICSGVINLSI